MGIEAMALAYFLF